MQRLEGGCSCGAVRFALTRALFVWLCHCDTCKKRTGSAYSISLAVDDDAVERFEGAIKIFSRVGESGKKVDYEFCPTCGTTVRWRVECIGNRQCYAGGALDNPRQLEAIGEMYTAAALPWARVGCGIVCADAPDGRFVSELSKRAAQHGRFAKAWVNFGPDDPVFLT